MLRALARFLHGRDFPALGQGQWAAWLGPLANKLPVALRDLVFAAGGPLEAVPADKVGQVNAEVIAQWITDLYPKRRYPAVMIGSSNGALVHACAAMGIPWLPQTFLTLVRQRHPDPDDAEAAMENGRDIAQTLLEANPKVSVHHMHDPNQDRRMIRFISYFRLKYRGLPGAYHRFLTERLEPGGTIYLVDCERKWPLTRISDRHLFQFGAVGGATREEYFDGGEAVARYFAALGKARRRWTPPAPDHDGAEAEWGYVHELDRDLAAVASEQRLRLARIAFNAPEDLSPVVAEFYRDWYRDRGIETSRLLIPSFILHDPYWTIRTASIPFWMVFNVASSQLRLRDYLAESGPFEEIRMMLFSNGTAAIGQGSIPSWRSILASATKQGSFLGVDEKAYPRDFATLSRYHTALRALEPHHELPPACSLQAFEAAMAESHLGIEERRTSEGPILARSEGRR